MCVCWWCRYLDFDFFEHQIHWFSVFNSSMLVVFLCGLVAIILMRTLKADFARFSVEESDDLDLEHVVDESGWKHVHGMVPPYLHPPIRLLFLLACVNAVCAIYVRCCAQATCSVRRRTSLCTLR